MLLGKHHLNEGYVNQIRLSLNQVLKSSGETVPVPENMTGELVAACTRYPISGRDKIMAEMVDALRAQGITLTVFTGQELEGKRATLTTDP